MNPSSGSRYEGQNFIKFQNNIYDRSNSVGRTLGQVQDSIISDGPHAVDTLDEEGAQYVANYK